ncbi:MAG: CDP-diacylglycerol--glycerol-3-phosphate 3-phosphatidyltransferase [Spirochaetota bacterium]
MKVLDYIKKIRSIFNLKLKDFILIPNLFSLLRIILLIPLVIIFYNSYYSDIVFYHYKAIHITANNVIILGIVLVIVFTDFLDGFFARKLNQISELGKILDPLADKLGFIIVSILFVTKTQLPLWIMIYIIVREFIVFAFAFFLSKKQKKVVQSNIWGKVSTFVLSISFLCIIIFGLEFIATVIILLIGLIFFTYATINYAVITFIPDNAFPKTKLHHTILFIIFFGIMFLLVLLGIKGIIPLPKPFYILKYAVW